MANRPAPALMLRPGDREKLERMTRSQSMSAGMVQRARIVLLASEGRRNAEIAELAQAAGLRIVEINDEDSEDYGHAVLEAVGPR